MLICSYFVLVTIIIFDLPWHICIYIVYTEYFWLVMAGFKENLYTLTLKFVYTTVCLLSHSMLVTAWHLWFSTELISDYKSFFPRKTTKSWCLHKIALYTSNRDSTILISIVSLVFMTKNRKSHGVTCVFIS